MSELPENSASTGQAFKPAKPSSRKPGKSASKSARSRAREFALQALYQVLVGKNEASDIDVFTRDLSGFHKADSAHYDALLYGCAEHAGRWTNSSCPCSIGAWLKFLQLNAPPCG